LCRLLQVEKWMLPQVHIFCNVVVVSVLFAEFDNLAAHGAASGIFEDGGFEACAFHLAEIGFVVGAVAPVLAAEPVAAVAGDGGDGFLLEDAVDESALSAVDQSGDEFVTPVDIDRDLFVVDPGDDIEQALVDRFAVVLVVDIRVVEPEAVAALSADAGDEFIDDKILPGFLGDVHPALIGPVFIAPRVYFLNRL